MALCMSLTHHSPLTTHHMKPRAHIHRWGHHDGLLLCLTFLPSVEHRDVAIGHVPHHRACMCPSISKGQPSQHYHGLTIERVAQRHIGRPCPTSWSVGVPRRHTCLLAGVLERALTRYTQPQTTLLPGTLPPTSRTQTRDRAWLAGGSTSPLRTLPSCMVLLLQ